MTSSFQKSRACRRRALMMVPPLLLAAAGVLEAQYPARPWLDWRTLDTRHFSVHFPADAEPWARLVAERMDGVRDVVGGIVGHAAPGRTHIVVDDPFNAANGFAVPILDRPVAVLFTTPPTPVQTIGHFRGWGELLAVHEYAHLAHLTIPARNPRDRLLMALSPWPGSPVATRAPRWVIEGYATYIEGRVTAHGRPHNAWRAAVLRQWALEGRLPSYGQLGATDGYLAGSFAYLAGSAFLEHVARGDTLSPHPDSSLAYLWRRMSARTRRSFDQAFSGLHGRSPADAYGRFVKELSADAVALERAIGARGGVVQGELVQRLSWETGDPAVSGDGRFVATVLRSREDPSRVVVWRTDWRPSASDSAPARARRPARRAARVRDTLDVPDRRFVPAPREVVAELRSPAGAPYEAPRWLRGDSALLLHRLAPVGDGSLRHDLYVWSVRGGTRRVTSGAGVRDADPHPGTGSVALAVRCRWGACDVVQVDLVTGEVRTVLEGSPTRSFHRPRWMRNGAGFAVAVQEDGRWRIAVAAADGRELRFVDPDDGVSRYQPAPTRDGDSLVVVSERAGIMNLEQLPLQGGAPRTITRVTGAALAPDVDQRDGSVWFLSMHSRGLDLRRLPPGDSTPPAPVLALDSALAPLLPLRAPYPARGLAVSPLAHSRPYGPGPRDVRWLPAGAGGADGLGGRLVLSSSDLVGRLHVVLTGAAGDAATYRGGALALAWRAVRPSVWGEVAYTDQRPSRSRADDWRRTPIAAQLDARHVAGALGVESAGDWQSHAVRLRAGAQAGELDLLDSASASRRGEPGARVIGAAQLDGTLRQRGAGWSFAERLALQGATGRLGGSGFSRGLGTLALSSGGRRVPSVAASVTYGATSRAAAPYERFVVGGVGATLTDPIFLSQRRANPLLPLGSADGSRLLAFRGAIPLGRLTLAYAGASANDGGRFAHWQRTASVEMGYATAAIPFVSVPAVALVAGVGQALDQPGRPVRGYFTVEMRP